MIHELENFIISSITLEIHVQKSMALIVHLIILSLSQGLCLSLKVDLYGAQYVRRNSEILLNCSTDLRPVGSAAELLVNNQTYTDIRYFQNSCFSAVHNQKCTSSICNCSTDGLWFSHTYKVVNMDTFIQFTCNMKYGHLGTYSDNLNVTIVDIRSPNITTQSRTPFVSGSVVQFICKINSLTQPISLEWICFKNTTVKKNDRQNSSTSLTVTMKVTFSDHEKICYCAASAHGFTSYTSVQLQVISRPTTLSTEIITCFDLTTVMLSCYMDGIDGTVSTWEHSYKETLVRKLQGYNKNNMSTLEINTCKLQDVGKYTCLNCTRYSDDMQQPCIKILKLTGPPFIKYTQIFKQNRLVISVAYFSSDNNNSDPVWILNNSTITNSTSYMQTVVKTLLLTNVYNKAILKDGYIANLSTDHMKSGEFAVMLGNNFGITKKAFIINSTSGMIDLRTIILVITGVGIFILTATCTTIVTRIRSGRDIVQIMHVNEQPSSSAVSIYHSAPESRQNVHTYDSTDSPYLEVIDYEPQLRHSDTELKVISSEGHACLPCNNSPAYEDIDI